MFCECTNTAPLNNAPGQCITPCLDYTSLTCGNNGGLNTNSLTMFTVYLTSGNIKISFYVDDYQIRKDFPNYLN
jgi:hypothetical protein